MKLKMYLGVLTLILTFFGVTSQQQTSSANQELVLHFTNISATSQEAQSTISLVKAQLQDIGVDNIQIKQEDQGKLIITYYSEIDVVSVKNTLSKEQSLTLDLPISSSGNKTNQNPSGNSGNNVNYNLDIFEIQNTNDIDYGKNGFALERKLELKRFLEPVLLYFNSTNLLKEAQITKLSFKTWQHVKTLSDHHAYIIPEVRAGPQVIWNS